jgi:HEAT repeat protein
LERIIQNPSDPNFRLALGALIFFDEDAGYSYAIEQLKGEDALRWTSIYLRAIVNRNKTEYIDDLYEIIEIQGPVHRIIAGALSRMGEDIPASEISRMRPVKNVPWETLDALANTGEQEAVPFLKEHYEKSTDLSSRLYSAYALLQFGHPEYREPIVSSVLELGTIPPMDSDAFRDLVKEKGHTTDYGIADMFTAMELLEKIEQPNALEILAQVATQTTETNPPISKHALELIAKDQSEESLGMLLELTESGVVPLTNFRAKLFALYQDEKAEQQMESVLSPWEVEKYLIVAETKGWRGFFRDPRVN